MCCYGNCPLDFKLECDYFLLFSSWKKVSCLWSIAQSQKLLMNSIENSQSTGHPQSPGRCSALLSMRSRWKSQRGVRGTHHCLACLPHPYPVHLTHSFLWSQAVELEELYFDHDDNDHSMAKITMSGLPKRL